MLGLDVDSNGVRALISLRPIDSPESVTKNVKGNVATALRADGIRNVWYRRVVDLSNFFFLVPSAKQPTCGTVYGRALILRIQRDQSIGS